MTESRMPPYYDRQLAALHDLPDVVKTKLTTIRTVPPLGIGGTQVYVLQTYRQHEIGDTIFLEVMNEDGATRLVLPPAVTAVILRQHDALTTKRRRIGAKQAAKTREQAGIVPAFLKGKRKRRGAVDDRPLRPRRDAQAGSDVVSS